MAEAFHVETEHDPHGLILRVVGDIGMATVGEFAARLTPITATRPALVVIDLSKVGLIGSLGMGELVSFQRAIDRTGGRVRLAGLQPFVLESFKRARLTDLFEVYDTVPIAMRPPTGKTAKK